MASNYGSPGGQMTWLEYYEAVKRGDVETVKADDKDFRLTLSMRKSALDIAALHGHLNLVEYFIRDCSKSVADDDFDLIIRALKYALRAGHFHIVKNLENAVDITLSDEDELLVTAIEGGNIDALVLIFDKLWRALRYEGFLTKKVKRKCARAAFETGSSEMLLHVKKMIGFKSNAKLATTIGVPKLYVDVALHNLSEVLTDRNPQTDARTLAVQRIRCSPRLKQMTLLDVAGYFGHLELLTTLIDGIQRSQPIDLADSRVLESVFALAMWNNHKAVIQYLLDSRLVRLKPPCFYPFFRVNETFEYLRQRTKHRKRKLTDKDLFQDHLWRIVSQVDPDDIETEEWLTMKGTASGSPENCLWQETRTLRQIVATTPYIWLRENIPSIQRKTEEHLDYLLDCANHEKVIDIDHLCTHSPAFQNVDAFLCLANRRMKSNGRKRVYVYSEHNCEKSKDVYVAAFRDSYNPNLALIDAVLNLCWDAACPCRVRHNPLEIYVSSCKPAGDETWTNLDQIIEKEEMYIDVFIKNGCPKPAANVLCDMISQFFGTCDENSPIALTRFLCLLQSRKISIPDLRISSCGDWFLEYWPERDLFLTELLIALSASQDKVENLEFECLLVYFVEPAPRRSHFIRCLEETRINVTDVHMVMGEIQETVGFLEVLRATSNMKCPTLQQCCRLAIHRHCLSIADRSKSYVSVKTLVREASEALPPLLREYLLYSDVYTSLEQAVNECGSQLTDRSRLIEQIVDSAYDSGSETGSSSVVSLDDFSF